MKDSKKLLLVKHNEGSYVMFLPTDLTSIRELRLALKSSLLENSFSNKAVVDIELAADEALTNSISANVISGSNEMIICRWKIKDHKFTMWIMDYGSGLKSSKLESFPVDIRVTNLDEYLNRVKQHQEKKMRNPSFKGSSNSTPECRKRAADHSVVDGYFQNHVSLWRRANLVWP